MVLLLVVLVVVVLVVLVVVVVVGLRGRGCGRCHGRGPSFSYVVLLRFLFMASVVVVFFVVSPIPTRLSIS